MLHRFTCPPPAGAVPGPGPRPGFSVWPEPILLLLAWVGGLTGSLLPLHWSVGVLLPPPSPPAVTWWKSMSRSRWGKRWTTLADFSDLKHTEQCLPAQLFQKLWTGDLGSDAPRKMITVPAYSSISHLFSAGSEPRVGLNIPKPSTGPLTVSPLLVMAPPVLSPSCFPLLLS